MSYADGEARILQLIQGIAGNVWTGTNSVSLANDSANLGQVMINRGKSYHYLMLEQGQFTEEWHDIGSMSVQANWQTIITILVPKETKRGALKVLADDVTAIRDRLNEYGRLNNLTGVTTAKLKGGSRRQTERIRANKSTIVLFKKELIFAWDEISSVNQQD